VTATYPHGLFGVFGIELEYMIVDRDTLAVRPVTDELLRSMAGDTVMEVERGDIAWSNELVLHVVELKCNGPARTLSGLAARFHENVREVNTRLAGMHAMLMPTAMHPWMNPDEEMRLWPHGDQEIYSAFDRIFDCRGHGWSNLQSMHINLPFRDDAEFAKLHAAVRLLLPILPALAASSPVVEGRFTGLMDTRLEVYRGNARRVASVSGQVIPEPVFSRADYERVILRRIYDDLAPLDPEGILREEWANARGAIARFDRGAIEIRVLDVQECPAADLAIAATVVAVLRALIAETWSPLAAQQGWAVEPLVAILHRAIREGGQAMIEDEAYLRALGYTGGACRAEQLWRHLVGVSLPGEAGGDEFAPALEVILGEGALARRIAAALRAEPGVANLGPGDPLPPSALDAVYTRLAACLANNRMFHANAGNAPRS
jgi:gamma-glutamyl:cysteine ligase YbdK (ATP-grasp superfamily)